MDPKPHHSESTSRDSGNGAGSNGRDADRQPDGPLSDDAFERKLARERALLALKRERAETREATARARTVEHQERDARKTRRRRRFLESLERVTAALLPPVIAIATIGFAIAALLVDPRFLTGIALLTPLGLLAYRRLRAIIARSTAGTA